MKKVSKTTVKKYQSGGTANAKKVAANKKKVEANRKKVEANRKKVQTNAAKVVLGKYSPNSFNYDAKTNTTISTGEKGYIHNKYKSYSGPKSNTQDKGLLYSANYTTYDKPRTTNTVTKYTKVGKGADDYRFNNKVTSATSMDTTGYAAGKKTFVKNTKTAVPGSGNVYKHTSEKVKAKDVPKTLKKMQTFKKGGTVGKKKK